MALGGFVRVHGFLRRVFYGWGRNGVRRWWDGGSSLQGDVLFDNCYEIVDSLDQPGVYLAQLDVLLRDSQVFLRYFQILSLEGV